MTSSYMVSFCCKMSHVSFLKIWTLSIKYSLRYQTKCNVGYETDSKSKNIWPWGNGNFRKLGPERVKIVPGTRTLQGVLHGLLNQSCNRGKNVKIDELSQHRMLGTETKSFSKKLNSAFTLENMQKSESSSGEEVQSSKMATDISTSITSKHNKSSFAFAGLKDFLWWEGYDFKTTKEPID